MTGWTGTVWQEYDIGPDASYHLLMGATAIDGLERVGGWSAPDDWDPVWGSHADRALERHQLD